MEDTGVVTDRGVRKRATRAALAPARAPLDDPGYPGRYHDLANVIFVTSAPSLSEKIRHAIRHVEKHYQQHLTLEAVAAAVGCHPTYLCQRFREELGTSYYGYVVRVRLKVAVRLLVYSDDLIKCIAYRTGFRSPEIFSKVFSRWLRCSPTAFRDQYRFS